MAFEIYNRFYSVLVEMEGDNIAHMQTIWCWILDISLFYYFMFGVILLFCFGLCPSIPSPSPKFSVSSLSEAKPLISSISCMEQFQLASALFSMAKTWRSAFPLKTQPSPRMWKYTLVSTQMQFHYTGYMIFCFLCQQYVIFYAKKWLQI